MSERDRISSMPSLQAETEGENQPPIDQGVVEADRDDHDAQLFRTGNDPARGAKRQEAARRDTLRRLMRVQSPVAVMVDQCDVRRLS